jgi:hypothetical protein
MGCTDVNTGSLRWQFRLDLPREGPRPLEGGVRVGEDGEERPYLGFSPSLWVTPVSHLFRDRVFFRHEERGHPEGAQALCRHAPRT